MVTYSDGQEVKVNDTVRGIGGEGKVLKVIPNGANGNNVLVEWITPREKVAGSGIYDTPAPSPVSSRSLKFLNRG